MSEKLQHDSDITQADRDLVIDIFNLVDKGFRVGDDETILKAARLIRDLRIGSSIAEIEKRYPDLR